LTPTELPDFLERVAALFDTAHRKAAPRGHALSHGAESLLRASMTELLSAPRAFSDVYGQDGSVFFVLLAAHVREAGDDALANLLLNLGTGLANGSLAPPAGPIPLQRFSGFVYPVI